MMTLNGSHPLRLSQTGLDAAANSGRKRVVVVVIVVVVVVVLLLVFFFFFFFFFFVLAEAARVADFVVKVFGHGGAQVVARQELALPQLRGAPATRESG